VKNEVNFPHDPGKLSAARRHLASHDFQTGIVDDAGEVLDAPGRAVIDHDYSPPFPEQAFDQM
jgi:hypothetical protein